MIYFLSDAHLGSLAIEKGWAHQKKLINLLEKMSEDAVSIYMLGDMFDFWMEYYIHDKSKQNSSKKASTSISSPAIMTSGPSAVWQN